MCRVRLCHTRNKLKKVSWNTFKNKFSYESIFHPCNDTRTHIFGISWKKVSAIQTVAVDMKSYLRKIDPK